MQSYTIKSLWRENTKSKIVTKVLKTEETAWHLIDFLKLITGFNAGKFAGEDICEGGKCNKLTFGLYIRCVCVCVCVRVLSLRYFW